MTSFIKHAIISLLYKSILTYKDNNFRNNANPQKISPVALMIGKIYLKGTKPYFSIVSV